MREVETISSGTVKLRASTLYAALDRLSTEALITVDREEVTSGRLRRYYRLTDHGRAQLASAATDQRRQAETALHRLGGGGLHLGPDGDSDPAWSGRHGDFDAQQMLDDSQ